MKKEKKNYKRVMTGIYKLNLRVLFNATIKKCIESCSVTKTNKKNHPHVFGKGVTVLAVFSCEFPVSTAAQDYEGFFTFTPPRQCTILRTLPCIQPAAIPHPKREARCRETAVPFHNSNSAFQLSVFIRTSAIPISDFSIVAFTASGNSSFNFPTQP